MIRMARQIRRSNSYWARQPPTQASAIADFLVGLEIDDDTSFEGPLAVYKNFPVG